VLRALREGDAVAAERLMTEHLANAAVRIASLAVPQQRG
jgi:DNA-binding GntR family transcriptional regulator